jgi:hypothetical protein
MAGIIASAFAWCMPTIEENPVKYQKKADYYYIMLSKLD